MRLWPTSGSSLLWWLRITFSLLSAGYPSWPWPLPTEEQQVKCIFVFCIFVCLVVYVQICVRQTETTRLTYICPSVLYIWCSVTCRTSFSHSHLRLFLSLIYNVQSTLLWTSSNVDWTQICDLTAEQTTVFFSVFQFSMNSVFRYTATTTSHCRCPKGRPSHLNEHSAPCLLMWVSGDLLFLSLHTCGLKRLVMHSNSCSDIHVALNRQHTAVEKGYKHFIWIIDASYILYTTHGMKDTLLHICSLNLMEEPCISTVQTPSFCSCIKHSMPVDCYN